MKQNEIVKLGLILLTITAITGLLLGGAYGITKDPIEKQIIKTNNEAMKETLQKADSFKKLDTPIENGMVKEINEGLSGAKVVGYAIKVSSKGYAGPIEIMVGISNEGKVEGIKILSLSETPGLGANAVLPTFFGKYKDKALDPPLEVVKTAPSKPNEIQSMTGATITSKAVTLGVNEAIKLYKTQLKGGQK